VSVFSGQLYAAQMPVAQAEIEPVVVTADRNAQTLDKAAPNVSVIGRKTLNQASAQNLDDIVMYESGVSRQTITAAVMPVSISEA